MIYGRKVGLRPVEEGDLSLLLHWRNDPQVRPLFFWPFLLSASGQKGWHKALLDDPTRLHFMIVRLADNLTIGAIGLDQIDYRNQTAQLGSMIIAPSERDLGWGTDAALALMRYAFSELNLHRLCGRAYAFNTASIRGCKRGGMKEEGIARQAAFVNGQFHDVVFLAALREEWQENPPPEAFED